MSQSRFRLTPALRKDIVAAVRAGGYPHVAAEAWGVPKEVFDDWLKRGEEADAREPYRSFAHDVRQAFAQARLCAEMAVYKDEPKVWLIHGPGRETEGHPGWSVSVKPAESSEQERNALCDPEMMALFRTVLQALASYPEARIRVAEVLMNVGMEAKDRPRSEEPTLEPMEK
jgi:hypothetical protein